MAVYAFITKECAKRAKNANMLAAIERHADWIEKNQRLQSSFLPVRTKRSLYKKNLGSYRLVAYQDFKGEDDELIILCGFIQRGSQEYRELFDKKEEELKNKYLPEKEYLEVISQYKKKKSEKKKPIKPLPKPSQEESLWLYGIFGEEDPYKDEIFILETEDWVANIANKKLNDFRHKYLEILEEIIDEVEFNKKDKEKVENKVEKKYKENERIGIIYYYDKNSDKLLLIDLIEEGDNPEEKFDKAKEFIELHRGEEIGRLAIRAYPILMTTNERIWLDIQRDAESNLALSPEELDLLNSIRRSDNLNYPLFINGRAGSGKSIMLQYLTSEYLNLAYQRELPQKILYLTSSEILLEMAKRNIKNILTTHYKHIERTIDEKKLHKLIKDSFAVFHHYLYSLLPSSLKKKYKRDKYISYIKFKKILTEESQKKYYLKKYPTDLIWHVLRSYIKGRRFNLEEDFTPEDFEELPADRQSVSPETYRQIYENIWKKWYQPLFQEKGYWDDQDLATLVYQNELHKNQERAAIFCDEAQDFTQIELTLIFELSLFSRRTLGLEDVKRVPIVLAGDPLQTINPTGFNWNTIKAEVHERFRTIISRYYQEKVPPPSYRELQFNYRSNQGVVKFCNLIQLFRIALLKSEGIQPQDAWKKERNILPVVWFEPDSSVKENLAKNKDIAIIINAEKDEELEQVQRDEYLQNIRSESEEDPVPYNIWSPIQAKGLEFEDVVLYKFGNSCPGNFVKILEGEEVIENKEEKLKYEYFLNKLYVGASRAKKQLIIVDTKEGMKKLWELAENLELKDQLMAEAFGDNSELRNKWDARILHLEKGSKEIWEREVADFSEEARRLEKQGILEQSAFIMKQAARSYKLAGKTQKANYCLALANRFDGNYLKAGKLFEEINHAEEAFLCYWKGEGWSELINLAKKSELIKDKELELLAAKFMADHSDENTEKIAKKFGDIYQNYIENSQNGELWRLFEDEIWDKILYRLAERLALSEEKNRLKWKYLYEFFSEINRNIVEIDKKYLAKLAYKAREYQKAAKIWEELGEKNHPDYYRAKKEIVEFPDTIIWLSRLKEYRELLDEWQKNIKLDNPEEIKEKDKDILEYVLSAALREEELTIAFHILKNSPHHKNDTKSWSELIKKALKNKDRKIIRELPEEKKFQIANAVISEILERFNKIEISDKEEKLQKRSKKLIRRLEELLEENELQRALSIAKKISSTTLSELEKILLNEIQFVKNKFSSLINDHSLLEKIVALHDKLIAELENLKKKISDEKILREIEKVNSKLKTYLSKLGIGVSANISKDREIFGKFAEIALESDLDEILKELEKHPNIEVFIEKALRQNKLKEGLKILKKEPQKNLELLEELIEKAHQLGKKDELREAILFRLREGVREELKRGYLQNVLRFIEGFELERFVSPTIVNIIKNNLQNEELERELLKATIHSIGKSPEKYRSEAKFIPQIVEKFMEDDELSGDRQFIIDLGTAVEVTENLEFIEKFYKKLLEKNKDRVIQWFAKERLIKLLEKKSNIVPGEKVHEIYAEQKKLRGDIDLPKGKRIEELPSSLGYYKRMSDKTPKKSKTVVELKSPDKKGENKSSKQGSKISISKKEKEEIPLEKNEEGFIFQFDGNNILIYRSTKLDKILQIDLEKVRAQLSHKRLSIKKSKDGNLEIPIKGWSLFKVILEVFPEKEEIKVKLFSKSGNVYYKNIYL